MCSVYTNFDFNRLCYLLCDYHTSKNWLSQTDKILGNKKVNGNCVFEKEKAKTGNRQITI